MLQALEALEDLTLLALERRNTSDKVHGAELAVEARKIGAENFRARDELHGFVAERDGGAVEGGELLGGNSFGGVLKGAYQ
jgi:hypothetical protein